MKTRDTMTKTEKLSLIKTKDSLYIDTSNISEKMVLDIAIKEVKKNRFYLVIALINKIL